MIRIIIFFIILSILPGCSKYHKTVERVDLDKFMGSWYIIAILPNAIEKNAVNGIESYALNSDGTIAITYKFRQGTKDGKEKVMKPKAKVYNTESKAEWRVRIFPPIWYPYLIVDLADDYRYSVIGVPNRKYVWIMSRTPSISDADYSNILSNLQKEGYKTEKIVKMPQVW
jgi:apolipoprotein D and lipocalin family protein